MATRVAAYTLKLTSLHDYYQRLLHGTQPIPSGIDMANTLKYFSQTLLSLLKEVQASPMEMIKSQKFDSERLALFPNLDYKQLYNALTQLIDVAAFLHVGLAAFGQALLQCLACLMPFLDSDLLDNIPYLTASTVTMLPVELHQEIINTLCFYILPFTITRKNLDDMENHASQSIAAVIMMVFQYSNNPAHHCQLLECLMALKPGVVKDILCVVAYGTSSARASAAKLLFYYWPTFNQNLFDRRAVLMKFANDLAPFVCQRDTCPNAGNAEAGKVCYDHRISITFASDSPPPLYLCIECANEIHRAHPNQTFCDILHPMQQVSMVCENKNCRSTEKSAISMCFSIECASYNGNHPIRYCQQCHNIRHNNRRGGDHVYHMALPHISKMDPQSQTYLVQTIVSLLKEAEPMILDSNRDVLEMNKSNAGSGSMGFGGSGGGVSGTFSGVSGPATGKVGFSDATNLEERQLLGRYGVWLLVGLCTPNQDTSIEILGRLLSMLFHWFHITAYSFDGTKKSLMHFIFSVGQAESTLEKLKTEYVCGWLSEVMKTHYQVFISCLLPHPADYVRVGGHWETFASRTSHLKDGLNRLFCLVPYEVINSEVWDYVMPHWMEAIVNDVPENELHELKIILSKILDTEMGPLGFDAKKMYNFVAKRFINTDAKVQEQALNWLQTLTMLEIVIPLNQLFSMFNDGVAVMSTTNFNDFDDKLSSSSNNKDDSYPVDPIMVDNDSVRSSPLTDDSIPIPRHMEFTTNAELNLSCCILMLDILLKQMELQDIDKHTGINTWVCRDSCNLMKSILVANWNDCHSCKDDQECTYCESRVIWHQLCYQLVVYLCPENPVHPPDVVVDESADDPGGRKSPPESSKKSEAKPDVVINMPLAEIHSVGGVLVHMPHIMTATVETVSEQLDLAAILPAEKVMSAVARSVTLSESDVATATVNVDKPNLIGENDEPVSPDLENDIDDFWHTTVGKFRFNIEELPEQLQFIHKLLKEITSVDKPDILYYMLQCLHILCLHGDAFTMAVKDHQGFFIWCQENLLMKNLWDLLNAEHSHIAQVTVPLLLHCITLPCGTDTFWRLIQEEFHSSDWRVRFTAVERITLIARFMDSSPLKNVLSLQAALANSFCYIISSMDDSNVYVAQRATLNLGTIHDSAIRSLIMCLETQFDTVIVDRPMVLQCLYQLHNSLSDRKILSWDFFLNRFDTLYLEAQISLEKSGDISYLRDLRNSDLNSEPFMKKLHRAQEALSQSDGSGTSSVKTLSASFGTKWPYKRTMSAPASMIPRQDTKQDGHIHSLNIVEESGNFPGYTSKIVELEESDKETMHLLVFLFMQFLSRQDQAYPTDEKPLSRYQGIVLRHLYLLLGYNQTERLFHMSPQRLRISSVFNVFISNLPQFLDQNHLMGWMMIPPVLEILQHCPCPPQRTPSSDHQSVTYSLWFLEPNIRRSWLMSLLVILYKYQYGQQPWCTQLQSLVKIVLNSLDCQHHQCKRIPPMVVMAGPPSRSRDVSQPSLGADHDFVTNNLAGEVDDESPPLRSQMLPSHQRLSGATGPCHTMEIHWEENESSSRFKNKHSSYAINLDEMEMELAVIPESPKSDSILNDSSSGDVDINSSSIGNKNDTIKLNKQSTVDSSLAKSDVARGERCKTDGGGIATRPTWFLGNEDDSHQVTNTSQKKWSVQEGVKMVVANALISGQHDLKIPTKVPDKSDDFDSNKLARVPTPSSTASQLKKIDLKDRTSPVSPKVEGYDLSIGKQLGRQKNIDQTPPSISSPLSPNQYHVIGSDDSSSPAVSSVSSQVTSTDNGQSFSGNNSILVAPTVERLLPIGTNFSRTMNRSAQKILKCDDAYASPESPLSKMDIQTMNSSFEQDSETYVSSDVTSPRSVSQLEFPMQERLLPIGIQNQTITGLADHIRQALGVPDLEDTSNASNLLTDDQEIVNTLNPQMLKQDSITSENLSHILTPVNEPQSNRSPSPRRLIKQVALESPPPINETDDFSFHGFDNEKRRPMGTRIQSDKSKRIYGSSSTPHVLGHPKRMDSWSASQLQDHVDESTQQACHANFNLKQSLFRIGDECIYDRCSECGTINEEYSDEELGLFIIILGTFIHREPAIAAPFLPDILGTVTKVTLNIMYPWQTETNMHLPGGAVSVAHQFLRCILHQLAPNGIFVQMFQTHINEKTRRQFFRSVVQALVDFNELNPIAPLQLLLETLNGRKSLPLDQLSVIIHNIDCYLNSLPLEAGLGPGAATWSGLLIQFDTFFRRLTPILPSIEDTTSLLKIMIPILKVPGIQQSKSILEPFSKVLSYAIRHANLKYSYLTKLSYLCHRGYSRERDKHFLGRTIVFELVQAMKFKATIPDNNFLLLLQFVLQDVGGTLPSTVNIENIHTDVTPIYNTNASESLRNQLTDILDFLADFHTLSKIKSYNKGMQAGLNEDTLGGILKCGFAQYVALEITRGNSRENKAVARYLPWLYSAPSMVPQGAREYIECIGHIRLLSWILLGALTHTTMSTNHSSNNNHSHNPPTLLAQPIPQEVSCHVADHVQVILSGFPEQSKASVLNMSSLFHAFILCQLWTVYLEEISKNHYANVESYNITMNILLEFWGKVTPSILHLVSTTKMLAEMVNLHFLSLFETLQECQSVLINKLFPVWSPILFSHHSQLPGHMHMRLENCRNLPPPRMADHYISNRQESNIILLRWLNRLQFKMGQIEMQSSTVTTQFYSI